MAQFWKASSVTVNNGSKIVTVNTGDDVANIITNSILQIGNFQYVEVKTVNTVNQTIELFFDWDKGNVSAQPAIAAPNRAAIKEAVEELRALRQTYEALASDVNVAASANSIPRRDSGGRVKTATPSANEDAVNKGFLGTAATKDVGTAAGNVMEVGAFGLGSVTSPKITDLDEPSLPTGFYEYDNTGSSVPTSVGGKLLHMSEGLASQSQIAYQNDGTVYTRNTTSGSSGWTGWAEIYHSGNSVNPLDYGIGGYRAWPNGVNLDDLTGTGTGIYRQYIATGGASLPDRYQGASNLNVIILLMKESEGRVVQTMYDAKSRAIFHRVFNSGWQPWVEVYHSGNTNFNEYRGGILNDVFGIGVMASNSIARIFFPLNATSSPTSLTLEPGGFKVLGGVNGYLAESTTQLNLSGWSSKKMAVVEITGLSGTKGEFVTVQAAAASSGIIFNF